MQKKTIKVKYMQHKFEPERADCCAIQVMNSIEVEKSKKTYSNKIESLIKKFAKLLKTPLNKSGIYFFNFIF